MKKRNREKRETDVKCFVFELSFGDRVISLSLEEVIEKPGADRSITLRFYRGLLKFSFVRLNTE